MITPESGAKLRLVYLPETPSTNLYAKQNPGALLPLGAVYTCNQTAGRGRLGRSWANAAGCGLYYTAAFSEPFCQPEALPLLASLVVSGALEAYYGVACSIKWPNDLLLKGKKLTGILCESTEYEAKRIYICGIGLNLAQPQAYFDAAGLVHGTSLMLAGVKVTPEKDAAALAAAFTARFAAAVPRFASEGFAAVRDAYKAACINLGRTVEYPIENGKTARGRAVDIDAEGRLVVETAAGKTAVFTGEVSVGGIYGAV